MGKGWGGLLGGVRLQGADSLSGERGRLQSGVRFQGEVGLLNGVGLWDGVRLRGSGRFWGGGRLLKAKIQ